jgi:hypothetical protein
LAPSDAPATPIGQASRPPGAEVAPRGRDVGHERLQLGRVDGRGASARLAVAPQVEGQGTDAPREPLAA